MASGNLYDQQNVQQMLILWSFFIPFSTRFGIENVGYVVSYALILFPKDYNVMIQVHITLMRSSSAS